MIHLFSIILGLWLPLSGTPKMVVLPGEKINFGDVAPDTLRREVVIQNNGSDTLKIYNIIPGCDCTLATISSLNIAPHEHATISVAIDFSNRTGRQNKPLTIDSNDPEKPRLTLSLAANVVRRLQAKPTSFPMLGNLNMGSAGASSVELKNTSSDTITLYPPMLMAPRKITARFNIVDSVRVAPQGLFTLTALITPTQTGMYAEKVEIKSSVVPSEKLVVNLDGFVVLQRK